MTSAAAMPVLFYPIGIFGANLFKPRRQLEVENLTSTQYLHYQRAATKALEAVSNRTIRRNEFVLMAGPDTEPNDIERRHLTSSPTK